MTENRTAHPDRHAPDGERPLPDYKRLHRMDPVSRFHMLKRGVPVAEARAWLDVPGSDLRALLEAMEIPVRALGATAPDARLTPAQSERAIGFARLVGQVEALVDGCGFAPRFDARTWLRSWLETPLPALGGIKPMALLATMDGHGVVSRLLDQGVVSAYA